MPPCERVATRDAGRGVPCMASLGIDVARSQPMDARHSQRSLSVPVRVTVALLATVVASSCREPDRIEAGTPGGGSGGASVSSTPSAIGGTPRSSVVLGGSASDPGESTSATFGSSSSGSGGSSASMRGGASAGGSRSSLPPTSFETGGSRGGTRTNTESSVAVGGIGGHTTSAPGGSPGTGEVFPKSQCRGFWDFETLTDGKVPDQSGHEQSLTINDAKLADGPRGSFLNLVGASSSATAAGAVVDASGSFSIAAWAKLDQLDSFNTIVSQDGRSISAFYLQKRSSGRLAFATYPADSVDASACITEAAIQPRAGEWYHLVATRDAATREQRLYVDGMLSGVSNCAGGFATTAPLVVGRGRWDGEVDWTTGGIDELCVLDRVMTPTQAIELYAQGRPTGKNYLFAYFAEQAQGRGDGLRLAQSHDALGWGAIGNGKVFLPPSVGGKSFRDPHVMRDPKGVYHVVWTTSCVPWAESGCVQDKGFGYARSTDLVHFSEPIYVAVDLNVEHVWAPETFYDAASDQYMVFWSSPIDANPSSPDSHSIYYLLTRDFSTFGKPGVLYSRTGRNFIDASILEQSGSYLMFLKDEADGQKNIRVLSSDALNGIGAWTNEPSAPITGNYGAEGPSALVGDGKVYLFFDKYGDGKYGALVSAGLTDLVAPSSWQDISNTVFFAGVRHGTPIEVPFEVYRAVALKAAE